MWGSQTTFQERNVANVIWDATNNMEDVDHLFDSSGWENDVPHKILKGQWNNGNVFMIKGILCFINIFMAHPIKII